MSIKSELQTMNISDLKAVCRELGVSCPNSKSDIIKRLLFPLKMEYRMKRKNKEDYIITYKDVYTKIPLFSKQTIVDHKKNIIDENKLEKFKQYYINTQLININQSKPLQKEFIEYLYGDLAMNNFTKKSLNELKKTLSENDYIFTRQHEHFFYDHKDSYERFKIIGILRSIGLDFLTRLGKIENNKKRRKIY